MRTIKYNLIILVMVIFASCELDNYDEPNATFTGKIVDVQTGETIQTRQPNGIQIRLWEDGFENPVSYGMWAKNDGTFRNTKLFAGTYEVTVEAGPFHNTATQTVTLKAGNEVDATFQVEPYVRVTNVSISAAGGTITGSYKLAMGDGTTVVKHSKLICHDSPIVHKNTNGLKKSDENDLSGASAPGLASMSFNDEITELPSGTYYVRVAVESDNTLGRNNYSEIVIVEL